jgi:hypothetical protein|tara:strand:- start:584 stop:847 length:264 start_codon:yes stop_codon:yes gene_type:complete
MQKHKGNNKGMSLSGERGVHSGKDDNGFGKELKGNNAGMRLGGERGVYNGEGTTRPVGNILKGKSMGASLGHKASNPGKHPQKSSAY